MPRGTEQLLVAAAVGRVGGSLPRSRHGLPSAADAATWSKGWAHQPAVAVAVAVEGVRTPVTAFVVLSASSVRRMDVRPLVGRASGVQATGVQATSAIRVSGRTRVRCPRPVHRHCPQGAGSWGGSLRPGSPSLDASGWRCRGGPRAAWSSLPESSLPESGLAGKRWSFVGRAWLAWVDGTPGRRFACAPAAAPGRPWALVPAPGCRSVAGEHEKEQVLPSPQPVRPGPVAGVRPAVGLYREVVTTLRGRCAGVGPVLSSSGGPIWFGGEQAAAALRPRYVRRAAARS
jgi:hypothetical protein